VNAQRPHGGIALVELGDGGLCRHFRLWWHSVVAGG
jgi:hypothetical protein